MGGIKKEDQKGQVVVKTLLGGEDKGAEHRWGSGLKETMKDFFFSGKAAAVLKRDINVRRKTNRYCAAGKGRSKRTANG